MSESQQGVRAEESRIRSAYAKREDGDRYSWFQPGHLLIVQQREQRMLALLNRAGYAHLEGKKLLEVGCGSGYWLCEWVKWGARPENLFGIDLLFGRLRSARQSCSPAVHLQCASATQLPFPDKKFDLVLQSTVFTSILDPEVKLRAAAEMVRVLKDDGLILWYDYHVNNPWNPDVRGVKRSEISRLFPGCRVQLERITLLPPLTRTLAPLSYVACQLLEKLPFLCTHYLGTIRKPVPSKSPR